jgi:hypothetical protein
MVKDSIYRAIYERGEKRLHLGFDYKDKILKNSLSSQMFGVNELLDTYLKNINDVAYSWIEAVKQIKISANPALEKYESKIK